MAEKESGKEGLRRRKARWITEPLLKGMFAFIPLVVVLYLLNLGLSLLEQFGTTILHWIFPESLHKFLVWPSGIITALIVIWLVGLIVALDEKRKESLLDKLFRWVPDPVRAFLSSRTRKELRSARLCVFWSAGTTLVPGLIRGEQTFIVKNADGSPGPSCEKLSVYWGNPPLFLTGDVKFLEKSDVFLIENSLGEIVHMLSTFGTILPSGVRLIPWPGETAEECLARFRAPRSLLAPQDETGKGLP